MLSLKPSNPLKKLTVLVARLAFGGLIGANMITAMSYADEAKAVKNVALVFDDGPHPENAARFIELFEREGVQVSFAQVGRVVAEFPETTRAQIAAGHEIINHSYSHAHPKPLSDAALEREIVGGQQAIVSSVDYSPVWYWPPYLERDPRMPSLFGKAGIALYEPANLVSSDDWNQAVSGEDIYTRATAGVTDQTVILFHEWRQETLEQMPAIIAELKRQGCSFHTFSELAALKE